MSSPRYAAPLARSATASLGSLTARNRLSRSLVAESPASSIESDRRLAVESLATAWRRTGSTAEPELRAPIPDLSGVPPVQGDCPSDNTGLAKRLDFGVAPACHRYFAGSPLRHLEAG